MSNSAAVKENKIYLDSGMKYYYQKEGNELKLIQSVNVCEIKKLNRSYLKVTNMIDVFETQNTFQYGKSRKTENLYQLQYLYIDIDEVGPNVDMFIIAEMLLNLVNEEVIPPFKTIVDSGRGFHIKWKIENAYPFLADIWTNLEQHIIKAVQKEIDKLELKCLVDKKCSDVSRIMRVPNTINGRNNQLCYVCYENKEYVEPNLFDLKENYLPKKRIRKKIDRETSVIQFKKTLYSLNYSRCVDFKILVNLRFGEVKGYRNQLIMLYSYHYKLYNAEISFKTLVEEVEEFNSTFTIPYPQNELQAVCRCVDRLVECWIDDNSKKHYNFKNQTIIDRLDITAEEQKHMTTLISTKEKYRRNNTRRVAERRNKEGLTKKQKELQELQVKVLELKATGLSLRAIAKELNITLGKVQRVLK